MFSPNYHFHRHFFEHKQVNYLYVAILMMNSAESLISLFIPIYLFTLGYSIPLILSFYLASHIGSVLLAFPAARLVARTGPVVALMLSTPFLIGYYAGLRLLPEFSWLFLLIPFLSSGRSVLYNFGFGLNFLRHTDRAKLGRGVSLTQIASILGGVLSPFVAGLVIVVLGFNNLFLMSIALLCAALLPLWVSADSAATGVVFNFSDVYKEIRAADHRRLEVSFMGYAIESSIGRIVWPIFLLTIVGAANRVGYIVTGSTIITLVGLYLIGKCTDRYSPETIVKIGTPFYFLGWVGSMLADNPFRLFFAEAYRKMSGELILVPWSAAFFRSLRPRDYFVQLVMRDIIFNLSRIAVMPLLIGLFYFDVFPFSIAFFLAAVFTLFYPLVSHQKSNVQ